MDDEIPYLLLTPGPLTTSRGVRRAMNQDLSTWDADYNSIVEEVRAGIVALADGGTEYTCTLMQGSGTFGVEAAIGTAVPPNGKIVIVNNGAYGKRMVEIADRLRIERVEIEHGETDSPNLDRIRTACSDAAVTHIAMAHCETTTGMMNPANEVGAIARETGKKFILDAMSSFGGVEMAIAEVGADLLISSANKCVQGVPGFSFVIARRHEMESMRGNARSLSLDLYDQWNEMESKGGKWRFTSPTHTVCAFRQALCELEEEGGVKARAARYRENHRVLVEGMTALGFRPLLPAALQSPIITSFHNPTDPQFRFQDFYDRLKAKRFVIYPGKVSKADCFRIGTIGHVFPDDIRLLLQRIAETTKELGIRIG